MKKTNYVYNQQSIQAKENSTFSIQNNNKLWKPNTDGLEAYPKAHKMGRKHI